MKIPSTSANVPQRVVFPTVRDVDSRDHRRFDVFHRCDTTGASTYITLNQLGLTLKTPPKLLPPFPAVGDILLRLTPIRSRDNVSCRLVILPDLLG